MDDDTTHSHGNHGLELYAMRDFHGAQVVDLFGLWADEKLLVTSIGRNVGVSISLGDRHADLEDPI